MSNLNPSIPTSLASFIHVDKPAHHHGVLRVERAIEAVLGLIRKTPGDKLLTSAPNQQ